MMIYNKNKDKGINWLEVLAFSIIMYKIGQFIFHIGMWIGVLLNK